MNNWCLLGGSSPSFISHLGHLEGVPQPYWGDLGSPWLLTIYKVLGWFSKCNNVVISQRTMPSESPGYHMQTMRWFKDAEQEKCHLHPHGSNGWNLKMGGFCRCFSFSKGGTVFFIRSHVSFFRGSNQSYTFAHWVTRTFCSQNFKQSRDFCWAKCPLRCSISKLNGKEESPLGKG